MNDEEGTEIHSVGPLFDGNLMCVLFSKEKVMVIGAKCARKRAKRTPYVPLTT
jgi:hypothetical protein